MFNKTIAIYTIIDDFLKEMHYNEQKNRKVSDAEIITTMIVSVFTNSP